MDHAHRLVIPSGRADTTVSLSEPALPFEDEKLVDVLVRVDAPGLTLSQSIRTHGGDGLPRFFAELDADFRGWNGLRSWRSLEGDLSMEARHSGRLVILSLTVSRDRRGDAWTATIPLSVLPGEELRRLVIESEGFFRAAAADEPPSDSA